MVPAVRGLVCAVCLYPLEVGPIVADPESLAVTNDPRKTLVRAFLIIDVFCTLLSHCLPAQ